MAECPTVKTTGGFVKGNSSKALDPSAKVVYNFLGIPYGKPPVGKLRFLAPQRAESWEGVFQAVHTYKNCPQDFATALLYDQMIPYKNRLNHEHDQTDEDCLQVNVFTPECDKEAKMPVLVWFTGGHYQRSYAGRNDGTALAGMNGAVVVVPNFRVNAFGFLSLGRKSCCPGNAALLDLVLCLEWVRENIASFGGDPNNVTIFGESSGSGMTQLLMMSSLSKGLFHKAILLSGSVLSPFLFEEDVTEARDRFLKRLGLDDETMEHEHILEQLQSTPVDKILDAQKDFDNFVNFMPTVDGHVITDTPANLMKSGHVQPVPLLIGCTDSEGGGMLSMRAMPTYITGLNEEVAKGTFFDVFNQVYKDGNPEVGYQMAKKLYMKKEDENDPMKFSKLHAEMFSDSVFVVPTIASASAHVAMGGPTYLFQLTQRPEFNHSDINGPGILNKPDFANADHADDLYFIWGIPFCEGQLSGGAYFTEDETELSRHVMRYFVNFAKTGNPNEPVNVDVEWPAYTAGVERQHMALRIPLKTGTNLALDKVHFFTAQLPKAGMSS